MPAERCSSARRCTGSSRRSCPRESGHASIGSCDDTSTRGGFSRIDSRIDSRIARAGQPQRFTARDDGPDRTNSFSRARRIAVVRACDEPRSRCDRASAG